MLVPFKSQIELPEHFSAILRRDRSVSAPLEKALEAFSIWLGRNQTIFFFEYTDHGIDHVSNVLRSADSLIAEGAWPLLSPNDISAIVASILLHDCAMHITQDGFLELISGAREYLNSKIYPQERSWADEFDIFQQEAARWDASKLMSVFGDQSPAELVVNRESINERQKPLVGEFLRRHHARLAHQIALNGVPGSLAEEVFAPFSDFPAELRDLYGFLARSHNLAIRAATDLLVPMRRRKYLNVHAPFVMAVLRVADYIQIDAARAPTQILQLRGLKSPLSRHEWAKHHAVLELHQDGEDPEALNVIAEPRSVEIFSGLRRLFQDLQRELDESWALLGEVYGRFGELKALGLTVRRLVSNLDDPNQFDANHRPTYIPRELRLSTATAELLELLVGPLYGNRPSVGARELLQNAIDAVLERASFERRHGKVVEYSPLVEVELEVHESGPCFLRVSDNGVGMTLDTVERYFLRAGASFRKSQWWKSEYVDEQGSSIVRRSGRFGVGVLAAFLVGGKVSISTRHFLEESGDALSFDLVMDGGLVEVRRVAGDIGTTVTVEFQGKHVVDALLGERSAGESVSFSDWFLYDYPLVRYRVFSGSKWSEREPKIRLKFPLVSQSEVWTPLEVSDFGGIYWSYEYEVPEAARIEWEFVACNGIFVAEGGYRSEFPDLEVADFGRRGDIDHPFLLVDDPSGRFPLNVQRSGLAERHYPFQRELEMSIAAAYARTLYKALPMEALPENIGVALGEVEEKLAGFHSRKALSVLGLCDDGWLPLDETLLARYRPNIVVYELFPKADFDSGIAKLSIHLRDRIAFVPRISDGSSAYNTIHFVRGMLDKSYWHAQNVFSHWEGCVVEYRFFVRNDVRDYLARKGNLPKFIWRQMNLALEYEGWSVYDAGERGATVEDAALVIDSIKGTDSRLMALVGFADEEDEIAAPELSPFAREWIEMVGGLCLKPM